MSNFWVRPLCKWDLVRWGNERIGDRLPNVACEHDARMCEQGRSCSTLGFLQRNVFFSADRSISADVSLCIAILARLQIQDRKYKACLGGQCCSQVRTSFSVCRMCSLHQSFRLLNPHMFQRCRKYLMSFPGSIIGDQTLDLDFASCAPFASV